MMRIVVIASSTRGFATPRDGTPAVIKPRPSTKIRMKKAQYRSLSADLIGTGGLAPSLVIGSDPLPVVLRVFLGHQGGEQPRLWVGQESGGVWGTSNLGAVGGGGSGFPTVFFDLVFVVCLAGCRPVELLADLDPWLWG